MGSICNIFQYKKYFVERNYWLGIGSQASAWRIKSAVPFVGFCLMTTSYFKLWKKSRSRCCSVDLIRLAHANALHWISRYCAYLISRALTGPCCSKLGLYTVRMQVAQCMAVNVPPNWLHSPTQRGEKLLFMTLCSFP